LTPVLLSDSRRRADPEYILPLSVRYCVTADGRRLGTSLAFRRFGLQDNAIMYAVYRELFRFIATGLHTLEIDCWAR